MSYIESARLGKGNAILVNRYLDITPDADGTYEILYEHFDYADGQEIGHHLIMVPTKVSLTKGVPYRTILKDLTSMYFMLGARKWDATRYEPAILLINGFVGVWKKVELRMKAKIKSPSGETTEVSNTWSDDMRAFGELKKVFVDIKHKFYTNADVSVSTYEVKRQEKYTLPDDLTYVSGFGMYENSPAGQAKYKIIANEDVILEFAIEDYSDEEKWTMKKFQEPSVHGFMICDNPYNRYAKIYGETWDHNYGTAYTFVRPIGGSDKTYPIKLTKGEWYLQIINRIAVRNYPFYDIDRSVGYIWASTFTKA